MRNKSVWERTCGLTRTVVEDVRFDDDARAVVVAVRPVAVRGVVAVVVVVVHRATTTVRVAGDGEHWISARRRSSSRLRHRGFGAVIVG